VKKVEGRGERKGRLEGVSGVIEGRGVTRYEEVKRLVRRGGGRKWGMKSRQGEVC